jgi:hypothetical protein
LDKNESSQKSVVSNKAASKSKSPSKVVSKKNGEIEEEEEKKEAPKNEIPPKDLTVSSDQIYVKPYLDA